MLGAAAEFERALIRERTKAGLRSAKAEGRVGGNPGLRAHDPAAIRKARAARVESHFQKLNASAEQWVPEVRRLRPGLPWEDVLRIVNSGLPSEAQPWSLPRLIRAAKSATAPRRVIQRGDLGKLNLFHPCAHAVRSDPVAPA